MIAWIQLTKMIFMVAIHQPLKSQKFHVSRLKKSNDWHLEDMIVVVAPVLCFVVLLLFWKILNLNAFLVILLCKGQIWIIVRIYIFFLGLPFVLLTFVGYPFWHDIILKWIISDGLFLILLLCFLSRKFACE